MFKIVLHTMRGNTLISLIYYYASICDALMFLRFFVVLLASFAECRIILFDA